MRIARRLRDFTSRCRGSGKIVVYCAFLLQSETFCRDNILGEISKSFNRLATDSAPYVVVVEGSVKTSLKDDKSFPLTRTELSSGLIIGDRFVLSKIDLSLKTDVRIHSLIPQRDIVSGRIIIRDEICGFNVIECDKPLKTSSYEKIKECENSNANIGDLVFAIGFETGFAPKFVWGTISSFPVDERDDIFFSTDIAYDASFIGAPLFNYNGDIIGIIIKHYNKINLTALPIKYLSKHIDEINRKKKMTHGYLGLTIVPVDHVELTKHPIVIASISESMEVSNHDIRKGDIILSVNATKIMNFIDLKHSLSNIIEGDTISFELLRGDHSTRLFFLSRDSGS